jgi:hypothetical protein
MFAIIMTELEINLVTLNVYIRKKINLDLFVYLFTSVEI